MDANDFVAEIQRRGAIADRAVAEGIAHTVLDALRELLLPDERRTAATALPASLGAVLARPSAGHVDQVRAFFQRVARREHVHLGIAVEHAQLVCAALAERLPADTLARLRRDMPAEVAALFAPPARSPASPPAAPEAHPHAPHAAPGSARPTTLAEGRAGSTHPVSEGRPPDRAQAQSVARADNPHGDAKLSSARGLTQEQLDESLATARPPDDDAPRGKPR